MGFNLLLAFLNCRFRETRSLIKKHKNTKYKLKLYICKNYFFGF